MANRHLSRSVVLQTLFEWDFRGAAEGVPAEALVRNSEEFAPGLEDVPFMETILKNVVTNKKIIDEVIEKAAPEWPLEKINAVDRNILRIGLSELLFGDFEQVPPKVAINEAIELAKTFGGDNSSRFINGVLGAVYKEMGEPGKDQKSKRQMKDETPVDINTLPLEKKAGAVVYALHEDTYYLALVHDIFGYWTLPKGGIDEYEDERIGAAREVKEEIGIDIKPTEKIGQSDYIASHPAKGKTHKQVVYYLAESPYGEVKLLNQSGGLDDARWVSIAEIVDFKMYDDITGLVTKAIDIITKKS